MVGAGGIRTLLDLLAAPRVVIRQRAAEALHDLCKAHAQAVFEAGGVPQLCSLLADANAEVRTAAASALAAVSSVGAVQAQALRRLRQARGVAVQRVQECVVLQRTVSGAGLAAAQAGLPHAAGRTAAGVLRFVNVLQHL